MTADEPDNLAAVVYRLAGDHAALAARVTEVEDRVDEIGSVLDDLEAAAATAATPVDTISTIAPDLAPTEPSDDGPAAVEAGLDLRRLVDWVRENIALLIERKLPQTGGPPYWCRKWWMHPEAIARFEALRRSWAEAVTSGEGNAMVVFFEHLDLQLGVLCAGYGPFSGCTRGHAPAATTLGHDDPDDSYFRDFEQICG
ncbi:hypothetical protein Psed_6899 (plasmid) [Pseudonocardia dioxanivorans CB1190]|uniref:DUF4913 domain-containing protein n=1 Tax=Pseudonocardia dioxanivorans (strain ATCC 55486 / DSM 44775 / JCM 13855 / CB1190) TaxID=675635 RepID=F2L6Z4_PSEUX|nr:DUF4913 domain-containing protein [Pseudonocardia dioxanivorans]AEA28967.1 hypothetical protein Psed_6899 [Pseudonocardia dioxanivorans CB1190]